MQHTQMGMSEIKAFQLNKITMARSNKEGERECMSMRNYSIGIWSREKTMVVVEREIKRKVMLGLVVVEREIKNRKGQGG